MLTFFLLLSGFWPISSALWLLCFNISEKGICFRTRVCFWWRPLPFFVYVTLNTAVKKQQLLYSYFLILWHCFWLSCAASHIFLSVIPILYRYVSHEMPAGGISVRLFLSGQFFWEMTWVWFLSEVSIVPWWFPKRSLIVLSVSQRSGMTITFHIMKDRWILTCENLFLISVIDLVLHHIGICIKPALKQIQIWV